MSKKTKLLSGCSAGTYSALLAAGCESPEHELRELLAEADARMVPCLTHSANDSRLIALVAVVRERTREESLNVFREVMHVETRNMVNVEEASEFMGLVLSKVVIGIRQLQRSETASNARLKQLKSDPKQKARDGAYELWQDWQSSKTRHKSGAAFHRYVVDKFPVIVDTKTIARWCKQWKAEAMKDVVS